MGMRCIGSPFGADRKHKRPSMRPGSPRPITWNPLSAHYEPEVAVDTSYPRPKTEVLLSAPRTPSLRSVRKSHGSMKRRRAPRSPHAAAGGGARSGIDTVRMRIVFRQDSTCRLDHTPCTTACTRIGRSHFSHAIPSTPNTRSKRSAHGSHRDDTAISGADGGSNGCRTTTGGDGTMAFRSRAAGANTPW